MLNTARANESATRASIAIINRTVYWLDGDVDPKVFVVNLLDDNVLEVEKKLVSKVCALADVFSSICDAVSS